MPVGVVGAMTVQRTLSDGMKSGLLTGLGSSVADCIYACIGVFGLTLISEFLLKYEEIINLLGGIIILFMGIRLLFQKNKDGVQCVPREGNIKIFLSSFVLGITNPAAIMTFLFAFSYLGISTQTSFFQGIQLVIGVFIGTYLWWSGLSAMVYEFKKRARNQHFNGMNKIFGMILIFFSMAILIRMML